MRIISISNDYYNSKVYEKLHNSLMGSNVENYMFVPLLKEDKRAPGKNVINLNILQKNDRFLYFYKQNKILKELIKYVEHINPSILHGHFVFSSGYLCLKIKEKFNIPYLVSVQNTDINVFFKFIIPLRSLGIKILLNANTIVFISSSYRELILDRYIPRKYHAIIMDKSILIPFGIDSYWLNNKNSPKNISSKEINIITVGVINKNKNQLSVAKAVELLNYEGYKITYSVIGEIQDNSIYDKLMEFEFVTHNNHKTKENLLDSYRAADIFVLPSIHESFGLVYAEAMSQGLPIIYSRGQGFDGQFSQGIVGYSVDSTSYKDIANKIKLVIANYEVMSKNAVSNVFKFNWDMIAEEYTSIYKNQSDMM